MKFQRLIWIIVLFIAIAPVTYAAGMVTYDPAVYQELAAVFTQVKELYKITKDQLDKMTEIQRVLSDAYQATETIKNTDLNSLAKEFTPGKYLNGSGKNDKINAMRMELEHLGSTATGNKEFYEYQMVRLKNLERLNFLQDASAKNVGEASKNLGQKDAAQITAQSTSTVAALLSLEEQRRQKEEIEGAAAVQKERNDFFESAGVYEAMGSEKSR